MTASDGDALAATVDRIVETVAAAAGDIRRAIPERRGTTTENRENPSGERVKAADAYADDLLVDRLAELDDVGQVASEERAEAVDTGAGVAVALDPLDGSSNIPSNNLVGTVFGVYDAPLPAGGDDLLAAGYVLYGPATTMMVARDGRVTESLVTDDGDRRVLDDDVAIPEEPTVYGFGGRTTDWREDFARFAERVQNDESIKLRYGGAMVGDVNQTLAYGGIFAYPALESAPDGKYRLQFEGIPMAAVVEAAGGASTDGTRSLLSVEPDDLHERTPFYAGSPSLVEELESHLG